ncbi:MULTISPECIES: PTS sugar transporter subunit IIB [Clostridium]|uniref:PTS sugar transporter subunit IIB n=1 Tax=Clostridium TaxID=1485 RepID=UPI00069F888F|nr:MULTISPECIES: PTS sugar transporter subunit IIB [Clostridium]KOF56463.1 PTS lactose transporter subunit IIB [Clostridium sp. DMHC 10]MCD2346933.1 PTS sugar transporter subunit IIB [Clostridium guangxiense]
MNIVTVCGMGMGSSLILKMNMDDILKKNGVSANVEACDLGSLTGKTADLVVTTYELKSQIDGKGYNTVYVKNVIDKKTIEEVVMEAIRNLNK